MTNQQKNSASNLSQGRKEKGTAIIVALFITALIAAIAIAMMQYFQINLRRTELILRANQGYFYTQGSVAWAIDQLNNDWVQHKPNQVVDKTPFTLTPSREPPYIIASDLLDAQRLLNINSLTDPSYQKIFLRLVQILQPQIDPATTQEMVKAIIDWITPGLKETPYDAYYLKQNPPYRAAHGPMVSVSELLLIKGITAALFNQLEPYITALPEKTQININNAPDRIIMSLSPTMSFDAARTLATQLKKVPLGDMQMLSSLAVIKSNPIPSEAITVLSNYFLLKTNVTVEEQRMVLYTLLKRTTKESKSNTIIIWQSKGTL